MKQKIPAGVVVGAIVIAVAFVLFFGWHVMNGGPNADVTSQTIQHWQSVKAQEAAHKPNSRAEAARGGAPMGGAPMGSPGMGSGGAPPMGAPPMGAPAGGGSH